MVLFYILSAFIIIAALSMVLSRNLVHSALYMAASFIGIAFIYLMLQADYMAVVQILVYVGAISILFIFGVMLTRKESMDRSNLFNRYKFIAGFVAAALLFVVGRIILMTAFQPVSASSSESTVSAISKLLLGDYAIPFEAAGILLLAALVGAIILGRGVRNPK